MLLVPGPPRPPREWAPAHRAAGPLGLQGPGGQRYALTQLPGKADSWSRALRSSCGSHSRPKACHSLRGHNRAEKPALLQAVRGAKTAAGRFYSGPRGAPALSQRGPRPRVTCDACF